ncbi:hypothetical protein AVEN_59510-1 [Araneus ventricosus]|uniref:Uncharacterized protein n=1 Tax=Araneus ventricosus TaxID=182803 RepID=A0A4Y2NNK0_ARAVE|nr:hypothetical protein AVEN_59510-1 [Araneus ventricosus]
MYRGEVFFRFRSKMGFGGRQSTHVDIFRRHNLSNKERILEIGLVVKVGGLVGTEGFLQGLAIDNVQRKCIFHVSFENGGGGGKATLYHISRRHNLSNEKNIVAIGGVVEAGGLGEGFFTKLF